MPILISDLDGTLLDVRDRFIYAQVNALAEFGYTVTADQVYPLVEYTVDYDQFLGGLDISFSQKELIQYFLCVEQEFYKGWQYSFVVPGAIEGLKLVRPKVDALRLITSRAWIKETRQEVKHFGLDQVFDRLICTRGDLAQSEGVSEVPLYPFNDHRQRLIQLAISDLENHNDVWVIGDSPNEMEAAKGLNYTTVGVLTGLHTTKALKPFCTYILSSVAEIDSLF